MKDDDILLIIVVILGVIGFGLMALGILPPDVATN